MRLLWSCFGLALVAAASSSCDHAELADVSSSTGAGGDAGAPADKSTLAFDDPETLTLAPGAEAMIGVGVTPAEATEIDFALVGDALDASLDQSTVRTDSSGHAEVELHAPATPATFTIRASVAGGPHTERAVSVSDKGFGDVRVVPSYPGKRPVTTWSASVVANTTCFELANIFPKDPAGAIVATSKASGTPLVKNVPVGPKLAVAVRAGHFAWGCADASGLGANATLDVSVNVVDKPVAVDTANLTLTFAYAPEPVGYTALLDAALDALVGAIDPPATGESAALLDAMAAEATSPSAFTYARQNNGWDATASGYFQTNQLHLVQSIRTWATIGLTGGPQTLVARLAGGKSGAAFLTVESIGAVTGERAGTPAMIDATFTAAIGDSTELSATIPWVPSELVAAVAFSAAQVDEPGAATMPDAMSSLVGCADLGAALGGYDQCDATCVAALCTQAFATLWKNGAEASTTDGVTAEITVSATGDVTVDDTASPITLSGAWLGQVDDGVDVAKVQGTLSGETIASPP